MWRNLRVPRAAAGPQKGVRVSEPEQWNGARARAQGPRAEGLTPPRERRVQHSRGTSRESRCGPLPLSPSSVTRLGDPGIVVKGRGPGPTPGGPASRVSSSVAGALRVFAPSFVTPAPLPRTELCLHQGRMLTP